VKAKAMPNPFEKIGALIKGLWADRPLAVNPVLALRLKRAYGQLPADKQAIVMTHFDRAHERMLEVKKQRIPPYDPEARRELLYAKTALTDDKDDCLEYVKLLGDIQAKQRGAAPLVDAGGNIWGIGKYQQLDPGWIEAAVLWLENLTTQAKFPFGSSSPLPVKIPNQAKLALAGDFGTGDWGFWRSAASTKIRKLMASLGADITVHLGDVYYAGTDDAECKNFVDLWPRGSVASFALNSNHEMYPGGLAYFQDALGSEAFAAQQQRSFFVLENDHWIVLGLDSAYFSDEINLYRDGEISDPLQVAFLKQYAGLGKRMILLTHHNALSEDGGAPQQLWSEVMNALPAGRTLDYWYWGHVHAGAVYKVAQNNPVRCRCIGHAALPWGLSSLLQSSPHVEWFEKTWAKDPGDLLRVRNGFAVLSLENENIGETFLDEEGGVVWSSSM
jgi:hypothetical protein